MAADPESEVHVSTTTANFTMTVGDDVVQGALLSASESGCTYVTELQKLEVCVGLARLPPTPPPLKKE